MADKKSEVTMYHNPRCSKSRQTLQLLRDQGIEPVIVDYLKTPPSSNEIKKLLSMLGMEEPRDLMRHKEKEYKAANLDDPGISQDEQISAMQEYPILIERPIVVANGKAVLGRPPENALKVV